MFYLFALMAFVGWAIFIASEIRYVRRTRDRKVRRRIWLSREILTEQEYLMNRVGLVVALLGLVLMFGTGYFSK
jgi:hypothetical protein